MEEIKITASIAVEKGNFKVPRQGAAELKFDMAGLGGGVPGKVNLSEGTEVDLDLSALSVEGWLWMRNLSTVHDIKWGPKSGGVMIPCGIMEPGEPALFRLVPGVTIRMALIDQTPPATSSDSSGSAGTAQAEAHVLAMED